MNVGIAHHQLSVLLDDYLESFGMNAPQGPLRAMGELTRGILWTGSVQLSNAARLFADTPAQLAQAVKRLSIHLADRHWTVYHRFFYRAAWSLDALSTALLVHVVAPMILESGVIDLTSG